jgi:hypothetical protein
LGAGHPRVEIETHTRKTLGQVHLRVKIFTRTRTHLVSGLWFKIVTPEIHGYTINYQSVFLGVVIHGVPSILN